MMTRSARSATTVDGFKGDMQRVGRSQPLVGVGVKNICSLRKWLINVHRDYLFPPADAHTPELPVNLF